MKPIQEILDEIIAEKEKEPRVSSGKWSPSNLGRCFRYQFWKRKGEAQTNAPDKRALRVFRVGDMFHSFVQTEITKRNPDVKVEVPIETGDVKGRADLVTEEEVIDLKTMHSRGFHYLRGKTFDEIYEDKKPNFMQVGWYCKELGKNRGRIVFISKDDLCIQEVAFPITNKILTDVEGELCDLRYFWDNDELPPAQPRAYSGKECGFCPFKDKCEQKEKDGTQSPK